VVPQVPSDTFNFLSGLYAVCNVATKFFVLSGVVSNRKGELPQRESNTFCCQRLWLRKSCIHMMVVIVSLFTSAGTLLAANSVARTSGFGWFAHGGLEVKLRLRLRALPLLWEQIVYRGGSHVI